jgi:hypothetical protein
MRYRVQAIPCKSRFPLTPDQEKRSTWLARLAYWVANRNYPWLPIFLCLLTAALSTVPYTLLGWSWKLSGLYQLFILTHEIGHVLVMTLLGIPVLGVYSFFILAFTVGHGDPQQITPARQVLLAFGGLALGCFYGLIVYVIYRLTGDQLWADVAGLSMFVTTINLLPFELRSFRSDGSKLLYAVMYSLTEWEDNVLLGFISLIMLVVAGLTMFFMGPISLLYVGLTAHTAWTDQPDGYVSPRAMPKVTAWLFAALYLALAAVSLWVLSLHFPWTPFSPAVHLILWLKGWLSP